MSSAKEKDSKDADKKGPSSKQLHGNSGDKKMTRSKTQKAEINFKGKQVNYEDVFTLKQVIN